MKKTRIILTSSILLLLLVLFGGFTFIKMKGSGEVLRVEGGTIAQNSLERQNISLSSGAKLSVMVAQDNSERILGLSGYPALSKNEGMLFIFDEPGKQPIWMKDMLFELDILWFNERRELVHIVENATPDSYPESIFYSSQEALYVLEVPAHFVVENGIRLGDTFSFQ